MKRREEFEYVMNKYPDSPRTFVLKTDLLRRGVIPTGEAVKQAQDIYTSKVSRLVFPWNQQDYKQEHASIPIDFYFDDLTHVQFALGRPENGPYTLDYIDERFWITSDDEKMEEVYFPEEPRFVTVRTSGGAEMGLIAHRMGSDGFFFIPFGHCGYWADKNQCLFCHYNFDISRGRKIDPNFRVSLDLQGIYETTKEALKERGRWRRIMITGGSEPQDNYERESEVYYQVVEAVAKAVRESCPGREDPPPIYLIATPFAEEQLIALKQAGVSAFGFYLETWDPEQFKLVCPGKHKHIGRERIIEMAMKGVDIFGEGNAMAGFVVGTEMAPPPYGFPDMEEALESSLSGYEYLIKNRVVPQGTLWSIQHGTGFYRMGAKQPPLEFYVRLDRGRIDLLRKHWNGRLSADAMDYKYQTIGTYCDWQRLLLDDWEGAEDGLATQRHN